MNDEIYDEWIKYNNINKQNAILYEELYKNTYNYQSFKIKKEIDKICQILYKELNECLKYTKTKGIIK